MTGTKERTKERVAEPLRDMGSVRISLSQRPSYGDDEEIRSMGVVNL